MKNKQSGLTVIELIVVVSLMSIFAVLTLSYFIDYRNEQMVRTAVVEVSSIIKETRLKTLSAETTDKYGLHFDSDKVVLFVGDIYDSASSTNQEFLINQAILDTNLSDGSDEIIFERLTGVPSATGTITIYDKSYNSTVALPIKDSGLIEL